MNRSHAARAGRLALLLLLLALPAAAAAQARPAELFEKRVESIPMHDGVRLNTEIYLTFVENIFEATEEDFVKATQRVYRSPRFPSHLVLPIGTR